MVAIYLSCGLIYYLLFCPTVTCFGAPYPVVGKVQLAGRIDPLAAAEKQHYTCNGCLFLQRRRALTRVSFPPFLFFLWPFFCFWPCRRWGRATTWSRPLCPSRTRLHRGTHQPQGWSRRCSAANMADTSRALYRRNHPFSPDLGVPSRATQRRRTQRRRPTSITRTRAETAMACLRARGRWIRCPRPCV